MLAIPLLQLLNPIRDIHLVHRTPRDTIPGIPTRRAVRTVLLLIRLRRGIRPILRGIRTACRLMVLPIQVRKLQADRRQEVCREA